MLLGLDLPSAGSSTVRGVPYAQLRRPLHEVGAGIRRWVRTLLKSLAAEGRTVFVSSHLMTEMALTADHLIVIARGRLIADASTDELISHSAHNYVLLRSPDGARLQELIRRAGGRVHAFDNQAFDNRFRESDAVGVDQVAFGALDVLDRSLCSARHRRVERHHLPAVRVPAAPRQGRRGVDPTELSLSGIYLAQIAFGALTVLAISSEYSTGMIRATRSAVPQRRMLLTAKGLVVVGGTFALAEVLSSAASWIGQLILSGADAGSSLGQSGCAPLSGAAVSHRDRHAGLRTRRADTQYRRGAVGTSMTQPRCGCGAPFIISDRADVGG